MVIYIFGVQIILRVEKLSKTMFGMNVMAKRVHKTDVRGCELWPLETAKTVT